MEESKNIEISKKQDVRTHIHTVDECTPEIKIESNDTFPNEIKNYLNEISSNIDRNTNPKLKKEHQRLTDLLSSYNRLTERLHKEIPSSSNKIIKKSSKETPCGNPKEILPVLPEIYAALRPDLYKDVREEEKKRFISKFTKKRYYSKAEKVLPPYTAPPSYLLQDRRQNEKDRFCRLVSTAPAKFLNPVETTPKSSSSRTVRSSNVTTFKVEDVREREKERLAKIFATSSVNNRKSFRKIKETFNPNSQMQFNKDDPLNDIEENMVRAGEYSPLNGQLRGKTTLGVGEHDEQQKQLVEERKREYKSFVAKQKNGEKITHDRIETNNKMQWKPRVSSASTQTDSEESSTSFHDNEVEDSPVQSAVSSPRQRRMMEFSPREKLLSDLYGCPPITHYQAALNEKEKQVAYAEALRAQIEEKKRIEAERKRREKEEEELIEKRIREQTERLRTEYLKEQNKKYDWIQQKQAQEEILRRRLEELELESIELKKQERQKKFQKSNEIEQKPQRFTPSRRVLQKRQTSQSSQNSVGSTRHIEKRPDFLLGRSTFTKSPLSEVAPLLFSDKQNILTSKANYLRRGHNGLEAPPFALGPGVNLLSSQYIPNDNGVTKLEEKKVISNTTNGEGNIPTDRYLSSTSQLSPRSITNQPGRSRSQIEHFHDEQLSHTAFNDHYPQTTFSSSRPPSPVVPALQTDMLLRRNSKILDDKWTVSQNNSNDPKEIGFNSRFVEKESVESGNILTQLGEFRRKLAMEHQLLEQRLKQNNS